VTGPARLEIDGTDEDVVVARAFVAGALRSLETPEEAVESARLAVSELVTAFVRQAEGRIVVTVPAADRVEVAGAHPPNPDDLIIRIASSVAVIEPTPRGFRIRMGDR
jgi:hypothetical protein